MTVPAKNPTKVSPWLVTAGVGAALVGLWWVGRSLGEAAAEEEGYSPNPGPGMAEGRIPNPAEAAWLETQPYVVPRTAPVERMALPNQCNPLDPSSLGPGRVCVAAGDIFVSVNPSSQHHVKKPGPTEVTFSENFQHYNVGDAWGRGVLDRWLSESGDIEVPSHTLFPVLLALYGAGWPMDLGRMFAHTPRGPALLRAFAENHYVKTPVGTVRIIDLPPTQAVTAFREHVATQILENLS